ncbi:hypothetical protein SAMN06269250_2715 [Spirosoma fluviale]|uniref:Uncharacterized protein n=1 Tax=Spirosoma fluviale TaxID=1597977 RepID=A0A286G0K5_9BACT|nr:hypothetical protein SAMN06269250_2715 [Spirosoma fluviale]
MHKTDPFRNVQTAMTDMLSGLIVTAKQFTDKHGTQPQKA